MQGIQTRSLIPSTRIEAECVKHLASETLLKLKQRKIYRTWPKNDATIRNILNKLLKTRASILYLNLKFDETWNDCLTRILVFFIRSWIEKNKLLLKKIILTHLTEKELPLPSRITIVTQEKIFPFHIYKFLLFLQENSREFYPNSRSFS